MWQTSCSDQMDRQQTTMLSRPPPVPLGTPTSWFDGAPLVTCAAFFVHDGRLTEPIDAFAHPFWNTVREHVANKAMEMRRQGFVGAAMLPMAELEYTGITEKLAALDKRFVARAPAAVAAA